MTAAALVADAERQLSDALAPLHAAVADGEHDQETLRLLNAAANHVSCALTRLARIETPARQASPQDSFPGGPVQPPGPTGERLVPGSGAAVAPAVTESGGTAVVAVPVAGAPNPPAASEGGRAGGSAVLASVPGAVPEFAAGVDTLGGRFVLPEPAGPPRFDEGVHRLVGRVGAR